MKDTEIHEGLENEFLRDYFSDQIVLAHKTLIENNQIRDEKAKETSLLARQNNFEYSISSCENRIDQEQRELKRLKGLQAIKLLINSQGWEERDVSDETYRTDVMGRSFIGTEEEYNCLLKKIDSLQQV